MIFRAIFWIAVVAILMPREPDLGLGRPGATASLPSAIFAQLARLAEPQAAGCKGRATDCIAASALQHTVFQSFADVKAEIEEARRERLAAR